MKRKVLNVFCALLGVTLSAKDAVIAESVMNKIPQDGGLPRGWSRIALDAVRNEHEMFQIIVRSDADIERPVVGVADLKDKTGNLFSSRNIRVFQAHYIPCADADGVRRFYPDALLPGLPSRIRKDRNQAYYIDIHIPKDQAPGLYSGVVSVELDGRKFTFSLTLRVRTLVLPDAPSVHSAFLLWKVQRQISVYYGVPAGSPEYQALLQKLYWFLVDRRLMPTTLPVPLTSDAAVEYLRNPKVNTYSLGWIPDAEKLKPLCAALKTLGILENGFVYAWDEPKDREIEQYKTYYERTKKAVPEASFLLTDNHNHLPLLTDCADILCPGIATYDPVLFQAEQKRGKRVWWYSCDIPTAPYPTYHIADAGTAPRLLGWLQSKYGIEGSLYWSAVLWTTHGTNGFVKADLWNKTADQAPGDGLLIYPPEKITGEPVSSLRLELIRQGNEEIDLLNLLRAGLIRTAEKLHVDYSADERIFSIVNRVAPTRVTWTKDSHFLEQVRSDLLDELESLKNGPPALLHASHPEGRVNSGTPLRFMVFTENGNRINVSPSAELRKVRNGVIFELPAPDGGLEIRIEVEKNGRKNRLKRFYCGTVSRDESEMLLGASKWSLPDPINYVRSSGILRDDGLHLRFEAKEWPMIVIPVDVSAKYRWLRITVANPEKKRVTAGLAMETLDSKTVRSTGTINVDGGKSRSFVFPFNPENSKLDQRIETIKLYMRPLQTPRNLILKELSLHTELPESDNMK